jgi:flagellar hook-length control protein FliK
MEMLSNQLLNGPSSILPVAVAGDAGSLKVAVSGEDSPFAGIMLKILQSAPSGMAVFPDEGKSTPASGGEQELLVQDSKESGQTQEGLDGMMQLLAGGQMPIITPGLSQTVALATAASSEPLPIANGATSAGTSPLTQVTGGDMTASMIPASKASGLEMQALQGLNVQQPASDRTEAGKSGITEHGSQGTRLDKVARFVLGEEQGQKLPMASEARGMSTIVREAAGESTPLPNVAPQGVTVAMNNPQVHQPLATAQSDSQAVLEMGQESVSQVDLQLSAAVPQNGEAIAKAATEQPALRGNDPVATQVPVIAPATRPVSTEPLSAATPQSRVEVTATENQPEVHPVQVKPARHATNEGGVYGVRNPETPAAKPVDQDVAKVELNLAGAIMDAAAEKETPNSNSGTGNAQPQKDFDGPANLVFSGAAAPLANPVVLQATDGPEAIRTLHEHILSQVKDGVVTRDNQGNSQITVRLNPAELGELHIQVRMDDQRLKVEVVADNRMVKDLLMSNLESLKETLQKQNLSMSGFTVSTGGGNGFDQSFREDKWLPFQNQVRNQLQDSAGYVSANSGRAVRYLTESSNSLIDVRF